MSYPYSRIDIPVDRMISYYNEHYKGSSGIHIYFNKVNNELDSYLSDTSKKPVFWKLSEEMIDIRKKSNIERDSPEYVRLRSKFHCAEMISWAYEIKKYQQKIFDLAPKQEDFIRKSYRVNYDYVPKEKFEGFITYIKGIQKRYANIKENQPLDEDFVRNFMPLISEPIYRYCSIFCIDITPLKTKIEDTAIDIVVRIFLFVAFVVIFGMIAKCATS